MKSRPPRDRPGALAYLYGRLSTNAKHAWQLRLFESKKRKS